MFKKVLLVAGLITLVAGVGLAGTAYAQSENPTPPQEGRGPWGNHGPGSRLGALLMNHEEMKATMAEFFGMSVEDLDAALADGKTPATLADELGLDLEDLKAAMNVARQEAIAQAVADGEITQEQADAMLEHTGPGGPGFGPRGDGTGPLGDGTHPCDGDGGPARGNFQGRRGSRGSSGQ